MGKVGEDVHGGVPLAAFSGDERSEKAEEGRVGVDVVEGRAVVDLREVVEDVRVQARVHALAGAAWERIERSAR